MSIYNSLIAIIKTALSSEYYKQPIPSELDERLGEVLTGLIKFESSDLHSVMDNITGDYARVLGLFAERMASMAVRENNVERVKQGLLALLIYARNEDAREVLLILSLLHDATLRVGGSPKAVFEYAMSILGESELFNSFLCRSDEDKSIEAMGYEASKNDDGFLYLRTW